MSWFLNEHIMKKKKIEKPDYYNRQVRSLLTHYMQVQKSYKACFCCRSMNCTMVKACQQWSVWPLSDTCFFENERNSYLVSNRELHSNNSRQINKWEQCICSMLLAKQIAGIFLQLFHCCYKDQQLEKTSVRQ